MSSKEELAQSVGNANVRGKFDTDVATAVGPNTNDAVLFGRLRSHHDGNMTGLSLAGTVLARRYKILGMIDGHCFKAHDLALDQTVTVRQAMPTSPRDGDAWRQKVQQLVLVRNPNFLNVLDVVFDNSSGFVITERARGRSIGELLRERSRFELEDVLRLMTPLAGSLDLAAALTCCPSPISAFWLFTETRRSFAVDSEQRPPSEWPSFFVKLDVWELVRPRKNIERPFLTSKAQSGGSRGLAVRQAALLTYELLGGEKKKEGEVKRWFKPVNGLGDAGNSILYDGLQGSPRFETSEDFFHKLESAIRSGAGASRALPAPALQTREHSVALPDTNEVMRRFNRDTGWLATGVLGAVVFAALVLAVLVQDRHPKAVDLTEETVQARGDLLLNANFATRFTVVGLNGKSSTGKMTSGQASNVGHAFTEISSEEIPSSQIEAAASTPTPVLAFTPEINHITAPANASSWSPVHWQDSARVSRPKVPNVGYRSSVRSRFVDVKMRLIALWHQSLVRSERSRSWTLFSNSNKGDRRKVSYTAATNH
jgi:hypothetical protein